MPSPQPIRNLLGVIDKMLEDLTPQVVAATPLDQAQHVLWAFGDRELGQQPGGFTEALFTAAERADVYNLALLGQAFPVLATWDVARSTERGMDMLREHVRRLLAEAKS